MGYDLKLFRAVDGKSLDEAGLEAGESGDVDAPHASPEAARRNRALISPLTEAADWLEVGLEADDLVELDDHEGSGIQIALHGDGGEVHVPYWHRGVTARAVFDGVAACLDVLRDEGGFHAYDPQLGRVVRLDEELDRVLEVYAYGTEALDAATATEAAGPPAKPWWKLW